MIKMQAIGNVGQDPKIVEGDNGKRVMFSVAALKNKRDDENEPTIWINVIATGKLADVAEQYVKKGAQVFVDGTFARNSKNDSLAIFLSDMKLLQQPRPKNATYNKSYSSKPKATTTEEDDAEPF